MRMAGIEVSGNDGRTLVDLLLRIGRDADLALAHRIERAYSRQVLILALSPEESELLLGVLDDPPESLAELRWVLARDHGDRQEP
jgi:hypothetical protein